MTTNIERKEEVGGCGKSTIDGTEAEWPSKNLVMSSNKLLVEGEELPADEFYLSNGRATSKELRLHPCFYKTAAVRHFQRLFKKIAEREAATVTMCIPLPAPTAKHHRVILLTGKMGKSAGAVMSLANDTGGVSTPKMSAESAGGVEKSVIAQSALDKKLAYNQDILIEIQNNLTSPNSQMIVPPNISMCDLVEKCVHLFSLRILTSEEKSAAQMYTSFLECMHKRYNDLICRHHKKFVRRPYFPISSDPAVVLVRRRFINTRLRPRIEKALPSHIDSIFQAKMGNRMKQQKCIIKAEQCSPISGVKEEVSNPECFMRRPASRLHTTDSTVCGEETVIPDKQMATVNGFHSDMQDKNECKANGATEMVSAHNCPECERNCCIEQISNCCHDVFDQEPRKPNVFSVKQDLKNLESQPNDSNCTQSVKEFFNHIKYYRLRKNDICPWILKDPGNDSATIEKPQYANVGKLGFENDTKFEEKSETFVNALMLNSLTYDGTTSRPLVTNNSHLLGKQNEQTLQLATILARPESQMLLLRLIRGELTKEFLYIQLASASLSPGDREAVKAVLWFATNQEQIWQFEYGKHSSPTLCELAILQQVLATSNWPECEENKLLSSNRMYLPFADCLLQQIPLAFNKVEDRRPYFYYHKSIFPYQDCYKEHSVNQNHNYNQITKRAYKPK